MALYHSWSLMHEWPTLELYRPKNDHTEHEYGTSQAIPHPFSKTGFLCTESPWKSCVFLVKDILRAETNEHKWTSCCHWRCIPQYVPKSYLYNLTHFSDNQGLRFHFTKFYTYPSIAHFQGYRQIRVLKNNQTSLENQHLYPPGN